MPDEPIIQRVDHVLVRVDRHEPLLSFLTDTLALPAPWPLWEHPSFASAGAHVGNTNLELVRFGPAPPDGEGAGGRLYGVAFEPARPVEEAPRALRRRRVPASNVVPYLDWDERLLPAEGEEPAKLWDTVYLGGVVGNRLAERAYLFMTRVMSEKALAGASRGGDAAKTLDRTFPRGMAFLVDYAAAFEKRYHGNGKGDFDAGPYGPLGVEALAEVVVGATDVRKARKRWRRALRPHPEPEPGLWTLPEGPAVRVEERPAPGVASLVLRVRDRAEAEAWLKERGWLSNAPDGQPTMRAPATGHLDLRITE